MRIVIASLLGVGAVLLLGGAFVKVLILYRTGYDFVDMIGVVGIWSIGMGVLAWFFRVISR